MYFPTAGIEVTPWVPPLVAFTISFFTSMGGVSGAFLILPFQMSFLGYTNPSVSATNQLFNIVAIPSGVYRYIRKGRMVWPLTWVVIIGTLPGVFIGAFVKDCLFAEPQELQAVCSRSAPLYWSSHDRGSAAKSSRRDEQGIERKTLSGSCSSLSKTTRCIRT